MDRGCPHINADGLQLNARRTRGLPQVERVILTGKVLGKSFGYGGQVDRVEPGRDLGSGGKWRVSSTSASQLEFSDQWP